MLYIEKTEYGEVKLMKAVIGRIILEEIAKYKGKVIVSNHKGKVPNRWQQLGGADDIGNMEITMSSQGLDIRIFVLIRFGTSISNTTNELINNIKEKIKEFIGTEPNSVAIVVSGMTLGRRMAKRNIEIRR